MIDYNDLRKLTSCFSGCYINQRLEIIFNEKGNIYFCFENCRSVEDLQLKVLYYLTRPAFKTEIYRTGKRNQQIHEYFSKGINKYLGTDFDYADFELIYTKLGNEVNKELALKFIESGFDLGVLKDG